MIIKPSCHLYKEICPFEIDVFEFLIHDEREMAFLDIFVLYLIFVYLHEINYSDTKGS